MIDGARRELEQPLLDLGREHRAGRDVDVDRADVVAATFGGRGRVSACSIGRPKASPTITMELTPRRSTTCHSSWASNDRPSSSATSLPDSCGSSAPSHMPVPCISGHAGNGLRLHCRHATTPATTSATSSADVNGARPIAVATKPRNPSVNGPIAYITPFGIPVVPPVYSM